MARRAILGVLLFSVLASFGSTRAASSDVSMKGNDYSPSTLRIRSGDTITWTNTENGLLPTRKNSHTVTADNGSFDSGVVTPGQTYSLRFTTPGTYTYHCTIRPSMNGIVVVLARSTPSPTPTQSATHTARPTATPTRSASPSASPSTAISPSASAVAGELGAGGSDAGVIISVAIVAIAVLTLLGWFVYARFIRQT